MSIRDEPKENTDQSNDSRWLFWWGWQKPDKSTTSKVEILADSNDTISSVSVSSVNNNARPAHPSQSSQHQNFPSSSSSNLLVETKIDTESGKDIHKFTFLQRFRNAFTPLAQRPTYTDDDTESKKPDPILTYLVDK